MADLDTFCGSTFWDINEIWNTTNPDVPECFQKTVLVWVPCIFLWVLLPVELVFSNKSTASPLPWTGLNFTRMLFCLMLAILALADMTHWLLLYSENYDIPYVNYNTPFIKFLTYILAFILLYVQKKHGRKDSGILFIFWLLSFVGGTVMYRTRLSNALSPDKVANSVDFIVFMLIYPLLFGQLILSAFADKLPEESDKFDDKEPCPELGASFLSRMLFAWFDSMAILGFKKPLTNSDLWKLNPENECGYVVTKFTKYWNEEKEKYSKLKQSSDITSGSQDRRMSVADKEKKEKKPSILRALWRSFRWTFLFAGLLRFLGDMLSFASPLILQLLIDFVSSDEPEWRGYFYCALIIVCSLTQSVILGQQYLRMFNIAMRVRSAVVSAIYHKALRISNSVKRSSTVGEIVNLMSVDAQRLMDLLPELHIAWSAVIQIVVALYLLWNQLGPSVLAGIGVMILMIPVNGAIAGRIKIYQIKNMRNKDQRVKLMNEVLNGMKVLKLYAWEQSFFDQITGIRSKELKVMKSAAYLNASAAFVFNTVPFTVSLVTFATYVLIDDKNILDATKAFVSLSLFNIIRLPLFFIPMLFISIIQAAVSFKRMNNFLNNGELDPDAVMHDISEEHPIVVRSGTFAWGEEEEPILHNINLEVPEGGLVAVVGTVGTGKSSLISAILGEMEKREGIVNTKGSIAYVAQQAWIQNATVQDNITFGQPFEKSLYRKVIEACALRQDLEMLPGGDQTEIGEKGINLSGGQKQRVSLARAVYSNSDVIFLDDPLSAVDSHVGKHIFEQVIGPTGYLKNKTRLFVTNNITFLPKVDSIIVLTNGSISEVGSYQQLLEKKGAFADFLVTYIKEQDSAELTDDEMTDLEEIAQDIIAKVGSPELERQLSRKMSIRSRHSDGGMSSDGEKSSSFGGRRRSREPSIDTKAEKFGRLSKDNVGTKLIQVETTETGKVQFSVYLQYMRAIGLWMAVFTFLPNVLSTACNVGSSIWLSIWSQDQPLPDGSQDTAVRDLRLGIYGLLGFAQAAFVLAGSFALAFGTINASNILHESMLINILRCPMSFFDTTPLGRIVNRFSKDIDVVDATIPMILRPLLSCFLQVLSTLIVISTSTPIFMVMIPPMGLIYFFIQRIYISTSRQLKRLESITRSPIFSHFSESVGGSSTIRAYGRVAAFVKENEMKVDTNQICYYPSIIANRWLSIRLELVSNIIIFSSALFAVLNRDTLDPGSVGLSISYSFSINAVLIFMVRMSSDLETNIVAIERIKEYSEAKTEAPWKNEETEPPEEWPNAGIITFDKFSTRYREGLELVLKDLSCEVSSGEKIGIVGRTGAGKSSMTLGLFRIIEPAGGAIVIDNVDIFRIGLHDLRSKLTIIPQDPVLFSGTLRMNLDPFSHYSDEEVWKALEQSHLKSFVKGLSSGLQYEISEGGENISVGQRQLVCLARALLRKTKVLVLDEATAAVDLETDDLIQATIRKEFSDCTVLTIAHRLNTIMDSNRVMVLDQGKIKEFDSPSVLLHNKKSVFYGMCKDAGLV